MKRVHVRIEELHRQAGSSPFRRGVHAETGVILVTGGSGIIGRAVVSRLLQQGHTVRNLDLTHGAPGVDSVIGDVRNPEACAVATQGVDAIIHLAALISVQDSIINPVQTWDTNVTGTLTMLEAARQNGVGRMVLASSSAVYGMSPGVSLEPVSPYGASKVAAEELCALYHRLHDMATVSLRLFNVYGVDQVPTSAAVIPAFVRAALAGADLVIRGDGSQTRDFISVADVAAAFVAAATLPTFSPDPIEVGTGTAVSLRSLAQIVQELAPAPVKIQHTASEPGEVLQSKADPARLTQELGVVPSGDLRTAIADMLRTTSACQDGVGVCDTLATGR